MVNIQKKENDQPTPTEQVQLLFVRNENAIRAFIRALQPSLSDADDVLQETFLTVSRKASSFEIGTNFTGLGVRDCPVKGTGKFPSD
jgi:DNA-directed RNA polymerase specialized sigma24 family protein